MSVFRELFVEVPLALLEAKVRQQMPQTDLGVASRASRLSIDFEHGIRLIAQSLNVAWRFVETYRRPIDEITVLAVRLACGHMAVFHIDEHILVTAHGVSDVVDYVANKLGGEPMRKCTCVPYVAPVPCTARSCSK